MSKTLYSNYNIVLIIIILVILLQQICVYLQMDDVIDDIISLESSYSDMLGMSLDSALHMANTVDFPFHWSQLYYYDVLMLSFAFTVTPIRWCGSVTTLISVCFWDRTGDPHGHWCEHVTLHTNCNQSSGSQSVAVR